ncbi:DUF4157 domain-containing protein [Pseudomonadota bacterium]
MERTAENKNKQDQTGSAAQNPALLKQSGDQLGVVDNRSESVAQREMIDVMHNSPQAERTAQLMGMMQNSPHHHAEQNRKASMLGGTAPRQEIGEEDVKMKAEPVQRKENKTGLPDNLKSGMENLSGMSMDHVNVHYNSSKPAAVQAHAFAQGSDIHLASGQEKHLPHELGHVVQQAQGQVKPTTSVGGMEVNDSPGLEKEADVLGGRALQMVGVGGAEQDQSSPTLIPLPQLIT